MKTIRIDIKEIKEKFPRLYEKLKSMGVRVIITLFGERKSIALIHEYEHEYRIVFGSRVLFKKWKLGQKEKASEKKD